MRMRTLMTILTLFLLSDLPAQDGTLDLDFGLDGYTVLDIDIWTETGTSLAVQDDDKILVAGYALLNTMDNQDPIVVRLNPDGSIDESFAEDGVFAFDYPGLDDACFDMTVLGDGSILLAGSLDQLTAVNYMAVFKLTAEGELDTAFGEDGLALIEFGEQWDAAYSIEADADENIFLAGITTANGPDYLSAVIMAKLLANGTLDPDFGDGGIVLWNECFCTNSLFDLALLPNGKIIAAGSTDGYLSVYQFLASGALDPTFNQTGELVDTLRGTYLQVLPLDNGSFLLGGQIEYANPTGWDLLIANYDQSGNRVSTFADEGILIMDTDLMEWINEFALQDDGKILAAGLSGGLSMSETYILSLRMDENGLLDASWGENGIVRSYFSHISPFEAATGMGLQSDGGVVVSFNVSSSMYASIGVLRYQNTVTTSVVETGARLKAVRLFPNPASHELLIDTGGQQGRWELLDAAGRIVIGGTEAKLAVDHLPEGFYVFRWRDEHGIQNIPLIIQ